MFREDLEKLHTLTHHEGFKVLRKKIEVNIDKNVKMCVDKDNTANFEDLRYMQGEIAAYRQVLTWVETAQASLDRKNGRKRL